MAKITISIENFIKTKLKENENGILEIGRNELASKFGCAPSQINYVLSTRFTPYKGYYIESRRGGGGYIKITKVSIDEDWFLDLLLDTIGEDITKDKANRIIDTMFEKKVISKREASLIKVSMEDISLNSVDIADRNRLRASILKNIILVIK